MKRACCILILLFLSLLGTTLSQGGVKPMSIFGGSLESQTRSTEINSDSDIYGWLIGSWRVRTIDYLKDGSKKETESEWHFARVLEGRAIQDVYIVPSRHHRPASNERNRYGTSLRYYDSDIGAWRVTWINPVSHVENHLIGRKVGNEIIQEGRDEDGSLMRWCFRDITSNSFRWTGEISNDQGKTWHLGAEFFGEKM